jgi:hypothetical protein
MILLIRIVLVFGLVRMLEGRVSFIGSKSSNGCGNALIGFTAVILLIVFVMVTLRITGCFSCFMLALRTIDVRGRFYGSHSRSSYHSRGSSLSQPETY